MSGTLRGIIVVGLAWLCLAGNAVAEGLPGEKGLDVPGEGISGTLLPVDEGGPLIRLDVQEVKALGLGEGGSRRLAGTWDGEALPPIVIKVRRTIYEKVAVSLPQAVRRRRSLASRGAPGSVAPAQYETVARKAQVDVDISPIILKYAQKHDLDPWLLRGVIEVESAFRPYAVSRSGAGGLMQLMPGTASYLGCGDRFDPEQNIAAGARYLRMMLDRFGNYDLAIAAYNAGPGNVERYGGIPPFAETQRYVIKVKRAWKHRG